MSPKQQRNGGEQTNGGVKATPDDDRTAVIARLAYEKWQARGCPDGDDRRDWLEAEQEVLAASGPRQPTSSSARDRG